MEAYGCVTYLRTVFPDTVETKLVMAKAKVAPIKNQWSIHRYELMACLLGAKVTANIVDSFKLKIAEKH